MFTADTHQRCTATLGIHFKGVNLIGDILHTDLTPLDMQCCAPCRHSLPRNICSVRGCRWQHGAPSGLLHEKLFCPPVLLQSITRCSSLHILNSGEPGISWVLFRPSQDQARGSGSCILTTKPRSGTFLCASLISSEIGGSENIFLSRYCASDQVKSISSFWLST